MSGEILRGRVFKLLWLKAVGSTAVIGSFFFVYFLVLNHPLRSVVEMPLGIVDRRIPVLEASFWVYVSLWVYICLPSSLMRNVQSLRSYFDGAFVLSLVGIFVFLFFPTMVPDWGIDWSAYPMLLFLKESDASGNACPSLHAGFAVFSGLWMERMLERIGAGWGLRSGNVLWSGLIVLSTMTTKQHVFVDVVCGVALGALVAWGNLRQARQREVLL